MRLHDYDASGNCYKARLLLALQGHDYERVPVDIFAGDTLTDGYGRLNPLRETPVLELEDGRVITQSSAVVWFLADGTEWLPGDPFGRAQTVMWMSFEQERVMGGIGGARFRLMTGRATAEDPLIRSRLELGRDALDHLQAELARRPWLLGEHPTAADVAVYAYTHVAADAGLALGGWPAVDAWCERIRALPGYPGDLPPYPPNAAAGAGSSIYG